MEVSDYDIKALEKMRKNITSFISKSADLYAQSNTKLLDIAPQDHEGAAPFFLESKIYTVDIDPNSGATYIADICSPMITVPQEFFDYVVCTEVLEHTLNPFLAVENIFNFLRPGGLAFISTPFNFRIHGPLPDCWRFTEHGLAELFKKFQIIELTSLDSERFLAPIQYTLVVKKP